MKVVPEEGGGKKSILSKSCKRALHCSASGAPVLCETNVKEAAAANAFLQASGPGFGSRIVSFLGWKRLARLWPFSSSTTRSRQFDLGDGDGYGARSEPHLPVLLIPGIGGTILEATDEDGTAERVWVRILGADQKFRTKLWSKYDTKSGRTVTLDPKTTITVPQDRHGLHCCSILDPDIQIRLDVVYYFHDLIEEMASWGYVEGSTLFGFGYDFRQSNRLQDTLEGLKAKLKLIYERSSGKKVDVITHSMGGLVLKSFLVLYKEEFEKYVNSWIAVTCPFAGAPGFIMDTLLTGVEFVKGWGRDLFIQKWSFHQLAMECPSIYEMLPPKDFKWKKEPLLKVWRLSEPAVIKDSDFADAYDIDFLAKGNLEIYHRDRFEAFFQEALQNNMLNVFGDLLPLPFNLHILKFAEETRKMWDSAALPEGFKFFNIVGTSFDTPFDATYGTEFTPVMDLSEVLKLEVEFGYVDGDGTVPLESALADGFTAQKRFRMPGEHRGILMDRKLFSKIQDFLDPRYDSEVDAFIVPSSTEVQRQILLDHWRDPAEPKAPDDDEDGDDNGSEVKRDETTVKHRGRHRGEQGKSAKTAAIAAAVEDPKAGVEVRCAKGDESVVSEDVGDEDKAGDGDGGVHQEEEEKEEEEEGDDDDSEGERRGKDGNGDGGDEDEDHEDDGEEEGIEDDPVWMGSVKIDKHKVMSSMIAMKNGNEIASMSVSETVTAVG